MKKGEPQPFNLESNEVYKRYQIGDFSGQIINEVSALRHIRPASSYLPLNNVQMRIAERGVGRPKARVYRM